MQKTVFILLTSLIISFAARIPEKRQIDSFPLGQKESDNIDDESLLNEIFTGESDSPSFDHLLESFGGTTSETSEMKPEAEQTKEQNNNGSTDERDNESENSESENGQQTEEDSQEEDNPKTGFYFLIDWNTFLEVDDKLGRRINLRIQPKVGDPKRFYSVTVP